MKLKDVLKGTDVKCLPETEELEIKGITFNSSETASGDAFVYIKGNSDNGKLYAMDAAFKGAKVIITDDNIALENLPVLKTDSGRETLKIISYNFYKEVKTDIPTEHNLVEPQNDSKSELCLTVKDTPFKAMNIIGVTGTNGKTTVSYLLKNIFEVSNRPCGIIGSISYSFANKVYQAINTTPDYCYLEKLFLEMQALDIKDCVMEVSSQALQLGRVDEVDFDYGIFTNLSHDHLDFHGNMESYFMSKMKLFLMSKKANLINMDDEYGIKLTKELKGNSHTKLVGYSLVQKTEDYYIEILEEKLEGTKFAVFEKGIPLGEITVGIPGTYMVYNAAAAIAAARVNNIKFEEIKIGIETMPTVPGRFELIENEKGIKIIVDFAHTPAAIEKLLETLSNFKNGKLVCVFGCGGDRDKNKRAKMGKVVGNYADFAVITSDNPRNESQEEISENIEEGIYGTGCNYEVIPDRYMAIKKALEVCYKDDFLVIAGKGHEAYQIIGKEKYHFDDREIVKEILRVYK